MFRLLTYRRFMVLLLALVAQEVVVAMAVKAEKQERINMVCLAKVMAVPEPAES